MASYFPMAITVPLCMPAGLMETMKNHWDMLFSELTAELRSPQEAQMTKPKAIIQFQKS